MVISIIQVQIVQMSEVRAIEKVLFSYKCHVKISNIELEQFRQILKKEHSRAYPGCEINFVYKKK